MNEYPPGGYIGEAINGLPSPGSDVGAQTVEVNAGPLWGCYRIVFVAHRNPRRGMLHWYWAMESGERLDLVK